MASHGWPDDGLELISWPCLRADDLMAKKMQLSDEVVLTKCQIVNVFSGESARRVMSLWARREDARTGLSMVRAGGAYRLRFCPAAAGGVTVVVSAGVPAAFFLRRPKSERHELKSFLRINPMPCVLSELRVK